MSATMRQSSRELAWPPDVQLSAAGVCDTVDPSRFWSGPEIPPELPARALTRR